MGPGGGGHVGYPPALTGNRPICITWCFLLLWQPADGLGGAGAGGLLVRHQ